MKAESSPGLFCFQSELEMVSQTRRWDKTKLRKEPGTLFQLIWTVCPCSQPVPCMACVYVSAGVCVCVCVHTLSILPSIRRDLSSLKRKLICVQVLISFADSLLTSSFTANTKLTVWPTTMQLRVCVALQSWAKQHLKHLQEWQEEGMLLVLSNLRLTKKNKNVIQTFSAEKRAVHSEHSPTLVCFFCVWARC